MVQKPADPNPPPTPDKEEPIFTSPLMEAFPDLKTLPPSADVPTTFKLREFDEKKFLAGLPKDALHVEAPVGDANRAFERLQGVLKAHHVDLLIDATAAGRLKHPNPKSQTNYILYTEDLTAEELAQLLQQLAADDKKAAEKKPSDGLFDALVVHPLNERDHKVLETLMGVDPAPLAAAEGGRAARRRSAQAHFRPNGRSGRRIFGADQARRRAGRPTMPCSSCRTTPFIPGTTPRRSSASWTSASRCVPALSRSCWSFAIPASKSDA